MKLRGPGSATGLDRQMLPLINIVFLLMVFFMLVGTLTRPAVFQPEPLLTRSGTPVGQARDTLLVSGEGLLGFDDERFDLDQLDAFLRRWQSAHPQGTLRIRADAQLEARKLVQILSASHRAGVQQVQLMAAPAPRP